MNWSWGDIVKLAVVCMIILAAMVAMMRIFTSFIASMEAPSKRASKPKDGPPRCTETYPTCSAFAYDYCTGGRCKYHCQVYCKCAKVTADPLAAITRKDT